MSRKSKRLAARARRIAAAGKPARRENPKSMTATGGPARIRAAEGDGEGKKLGTFDGIAYTGAPMQPGGWWDPIIVELSGVRVPSQHRPVLRQHDHNQIVGHTTAVKVTDKAIEIAGTFSGEPQHTDKVTVPAKNGFEWQLSIGADPIRTEYVEAGETVTVNGREVTGPIVISRETELGEISFVPLGADGDTSATVAASKGRIVMNWKAALKFHKSQGMKSAAKYSDEDIDKMSEDEAKAALQKCMAEDAEADDDDDSDIDAEGSDVEGSDTDTEPKAKAKAGKKQSVKSRRDIRKQVAAEVDRELKAARSKAANESRRVNEIHARAGKFGGNFKIKVEGADVDLVPHAIEHGWTPDAVELEARRQHRPAANSGPHFYSPSAAIMNEAVLECAVFDSLPQFKLFDSDFYRNGDVTPDGRTLRRVSAREENRITAELNSRYPDQVRQAAHTHFKGRIGLQQLLTTLAAASGYRGPATFNDPNGWGEVAGYLAHGIRADGPSTINTPATLSNVQNKLLLQGYLFTEQSHLEFCPVLPVKDLKPTKSVQLFGDFVFKELNASGEIEHATIGDNPYANQAALQSRMLTFPITYMLNDDLNAYGQAPIMLGRGWGLRVLELVYTKFNNPGLDEGGSTNFFAAIHTLSGTQQGKSNLSSGAGSTLTSDGIKAAKLLFDKQVDPAGQPLGLDAEILLYPPELDVNAIELMNAQFIVMAGLASTSSASKQPNTNIWKGRFKPVMSRYLSDSRFTGASATAWYLLGNPVVCPTIQIAALNGQMTPVVQTAGTDWQFNTLGMSMRAWGGVGVSMQNFRGGVKSAGA